MSSIKSAPDRIRRNKLTDQRETLRAVIRDLEGLERLQQMQWRLLREVIREIQELKLG